MKSIGMLPRGTCVVLYYHGVPLRERMAFHRQMEHLIRRAIPISIDYPNPFEHNRHYCAVTFDDGFANVFENALPLMKKLGIPVAMFIPTAHIGRPPEWIRNKTTDAYGYPLAPRDLLIQWKNNITIGSHTVSHPDLTRLSPEGITSELRESRAYLEKMTLERVSFLSFPHGRYDNRILQLAFLEGYTKVFTIEPKLLKGHLNRRIIGRIEVQPTDWPIEFMFKINGSYRWMYLASIIKNELQKFYTYRRFVGNGEQ